MQTESSSVVVSGVQSTGKKKKARKSRKKGSKRSRTSKLHQSSQSPLRILPAEDQPASEPEKESNGFLASLRDTFSASQSPQSESPLPNDSPTGSTEPAPAPAASPDIEKKLVSVPDVIGEEPEEFDEGTVSIGSEEVAALMDAIAFEEQDVKDTLAELFDWLSEHFHSDHWKLTDRQVRMLGRPTAQLLNSLWAKLKLRIPDILARWCESTPGATAFVMAFGLVVVPKGLKQLAISKERAKKNLRGQQLGGKQPSGAPVSAPAGPGGIPTSTGVNAPIPEVAVAAGQGGLL